MSETYVRSLQVSLESGVQPVDWDVAPAVDMPPTWWSWYLFDPDGYELVRWYLHGLGIFDATVPVDAGVYSATYIFSPEGGVHNAFYLEGDLSSYSTTQLDAAAIVAAATPDLPAWASQVSIMAGTHYGESAPPVVPRFWTGLVAAIETV